MRGHLRVVWRVELSLSALRLRLLSGAQPLLSHRLGSALARDIRALPHGTSAIAAGVLETLQAPPTRSGALVHFLLTEDSSGLLQSTIFEDTYRRYGHVLYESGAYLLHGRVEHDQRRGFSFLVQKIEALGDLLSGQSKSSSPTVPASGTLVRAGRQGRRSRHVG